MMAPTTANRRTPAPRRRRGWHWLLVIAGGLLAMVVIVLAFGQVDGYEFSPQTFQQRHFTYYRIPLLGIQVSDVDRRAGASVGPIAAVRRAGFFVSTQDQPRWDVVETTLQGFRGDAGFLCGYLNQDDMTGKGLRWQVWTDDHPHLAAVFWKAVITMARDQAYLGTTQLFDYATSMPDGITVEQFDAQLCQLAVKVYEKLAQHSRDLGDLESQQRYSSRCQQLRTTGSWQATAVGGESAVATDRLDDATPRPAELEEQIQPY